MIFDLSKVFLSRNDKSIGLKFPSQLDKDLAYFIGIHLGDGTMNKYNKYYYSIGYGGHLVDEYDFYSIYINNLIFKFFNKKFNFYEKKSKTGQYIELCTQSKGIFTFLNKSLGIQPGPKTHNSIPDIIKNSNFKTDFIRGLADSDFSLTFKNNGTYHSYPNIIWNPSNKFLMTEVNIELENLGFKTFTLFDFKKKRL